VTAFTSDDTYTSNEY